MNDPHSFRATAGVCALIRAAGAGSRMGNRPKCLLEMQGEALIRRQVRALLDAGVPSVHVVLGRHADACAAAWQAQNREAVCLWPNDNHHHIVDVDSMDDVARVAVISDVHLAWPADLRET